MTDETFQDQDDNDNEDTGEDETEFTVAIIKPDAVAARVVGQIITAIETALPDLTLEIFGMDAMEEKEAISFYKEHKGKPFFADLIAHMISGPSVFMVLDGAGAVEKWRNLCGATDPKKGLPATLRARFGTEGPANAVHGSADEDAAIRELQIIERLLFK